MVVVHEVTMATAEEFTQVIREVQGIPHQLEFVAFPAFPALSKCYLIKLSNKIISDIVE